MYGGDYVSTPNEEDCLDTKIVLDFSDLLKSASDIPLLQDAQTMKSQEVSQSQDQLDTESESYTKLEMMQKGASKAKKSDKSDIGTIIGEERRRLLKKLESCDDDRIVFKRRVKNNKKNQANAENYRGSQYWGVSKNKSKWQVSRFQF